MNNKSQQGGWNLQNNAELILAEKRLRPFASEDKRSNAVVFCVHTGNSMHPTLSEHDLLEIEPYGRRPVRIGDVVFFVPPDGNQYAVHRVVRVTPAGIRTKGDSNDRMDTWFIRPEDVIGLVIRATRGKTRRMIYGGTVGLLWSRVLRSLKVLEHGLSFHYHRLARSGLLRSFMPLRKRMRIISIKQPEGRAFKLLLGNWLIGYYNPGMTQWQVQRPFRLFVDVKSLPT